MKFLKLFLIFFILTFSHNTFSQDMVYIPINPSFGGNYFNASWLLSSAQAQDKLTEGRAAATYQRDALQDFEESIKRQILSQLSRSLIQDLFGEDITGEGHYEFGEFSIDISPVAEGLEIMIFDSSNGGETTIIIPYL